MAMTPPPVTVQAHLAAALGTRDETDAAKRRRLIERTMAGAITRMTMQLRAQAFAGWLASVRRARRVQNALVRAVGKMRRQGLAAAFARLR